MTMQTMKCCPCCGGKPTILEEFGAKAVQCKKCGLTTAKVAFGFSGFFNSPENAERDAVERWNRRDGCENA